MAHPQIARALRLMNMEKNGTPTVAEFEALLTDAGRLDACIGLLQRPGAGGQITGYPNLAQALAGTDAWMALALSNASIMAAVAQHPSAMLAFINDQSALDAIFSQPDVRAAFLASTALAKASVPKMTSDTTPSGVASASSIHSSGTQPYLMFDKTSAHFGVSAESPANQWVQYKFEQEVFIHTAALTNWNTAYSPKDCRIEYSNDGVSFQTATSTTFASGLAGQSVSFAASGFYQYWRLFMVNTYGQPAIMRELNFTGFVAP